MTTDNLTPEQKKIIIMQKVAQLGPREQLMIILYIRWLQLQGCIKARLENLN